MTKVVAPLGSFSASGKIGKSLVYFSHLGRNVVRGLVTPKNPKTEAQGDTRLLVGSLGRAVKAVATDSDWLEDVATVTPAGQTWTSAFIRDAVSFFGSGAAGVTALTNAFTGHTESAVFQSEAEDKGLADLTIDYAGSVKTIPAGAMLYAIARYSMAIKGQNPNLFDRVPYTTELASWSEQNIEAFVSEIS